MRLRGVSGGSLAALVLTGLVGCSSESGFADLDRFMEEARSAPRGVVEPLPEFQAYEAFEYSAADRRAPFEPPIEVRLTMVEEQARQDVKPDLDRPKELLENFNLADLKMVGSLKRDGESTLWALISDKEGGIHRVRPGNFMGKNFGRIVGINDSLIELIEIVPSGHGGWVERPRTLSIDAQ